MLFKFSDCALWVQHVFHKDSLVESRKGFFGERKSLILLDIVPVPAHDTFSLYFYFLRSFVCKYDVGCGAVNQDHTVFDLV